MVAAKIYGWNAGIHIDNVTLDDGHLCLVIDFKAVKLPDLSLGKKK